MANGASDAQRDAAPAEAGHDDILVVGCFGDEPELRRFESDVQAFGDAFASVLVRSQRTPGWYLEVVQGAVSKWSGLTRYLAHAGLPADGVCAVGDALNDLPMVRGAALGVAMGNAPEELKAVADWVVGSNREDGVAMLIERLIDGCGSADAAP